MSKLQILTAEGNSFSRIFHPDDWSWLGQEFSKAPEYETLRRYYVASFEHQLLAEQLTSSLLFKDTLEGLIAKRKGPISARLAGISARLDNYASRLINTVQMLSPLAPRHQK